MNSGKSDSSDNESQNEIEIPDATTLLFILVAVS